MQSFVPICNLTLSLHIACYTHINTGNRIRLRLAGVERLCMDSSAPNSQDPYCIYCVADEFENLHN